MKMKRLLLGLIFAAMVASSAAALASCGEKGCSLGSWITIRKATCRQTGYERQYCRNCDHYEWRNLPRLPHTPGEWTIDREPTCTRVGSRSSSCTECGDPIRRDIPMVPHEYDDTVVTQAATCAKTGRGQAVCMVCGKKKSVTIDELGHDWGSETVTKEATCTEKGKISVTCLRCGRTQEEATPLLDHTFGEWTVLREPGGKNPGRREHTCTVCGKKVREDYFPEGTLYEDMKPCQAVIDLQQKLTDLGYYSGPIRTGTYGGQTTKAVARFQKANGLKETGVAYTETIEKLEEVWKAKGFGE